MSLRNTDVRTPGAAEIARKWNLPLSKVYGLISQGAKVEFEHNRDKEKAKQVARDHINERPDYYKRLRSMERLPIRIREGLSTEPERNSETIGDYTGASRKVMKVDEVKLPKIPEKVKTKVKKAVGTGATLATVMSGATAYDNASRGVGSPIKDIASVAAGTPGKVGWAITPGSATLSLANYIKSRQQAKKMEEQGSPANPARYTERPIYEEDTMKNAEDKIKAAFTADKVKGMFKRVDKQRDKDPKWVAYKKRKQQSIKEQLMTAKQNAAQSQGSMANLSPVKGGSISSSAERDRSFKDVVTRPPTGTTIASKPAIVPKYSNLSGVTPRVDTDTISKMVQGGRTPPMGTPKLDISVDKTTGSTSISHGGDEASKYAADAMRHLDLNRERAAGAKPIATELPPIKGIIDARADMEARRQSGIRGSTDPDTEKAIRTMKYGNRDNINPVTPSDKPGAITADAENQPSSKAAPTPSSTMGQSPEVKSTNDVIQNKKINEISAELVGKVSNARFWRKEAPSKTLSRAINKKFIESGKKKEEPKKPLKEGSVQLGPLRTHSISYKDASGKDKEPGSPESPGDVKKVHSGSYGERKVPGGKETEYIGKDMESTTTKPDTGDGAGWSGYVKSKTDMETTSTRSKTTTEPEKKEPWSRTGNEKLSDLVSEKTTMDTKDLINEALDDILENNLVSMKENLMTALQEKAMEKIEEKKKDIAANYFAQ